MSEPRANEDTTRNPQKQTAHQRNVQQSTVRDTRPPRQDDNRYVRIERERTNTFPGNAPYQQPTGYKGPGNIMMQRWMHETMREQPYNHIGEVLQLPSGDKSGKKDENGQSN